MCWQITCLHLQAHSSWLLSLFPPQTASVALTSHISLWLSSTSSGAPPSSPSERTAPHSPLGLPPSRPAVALTGRARWLSPDRSLASGRQPAPTPSLHEGQSDAGECFGGFMSVCVVIFRWMSLSFVWMPRLKTNKLHTNDENVCPERGKRSKCRID